MPSIWSHCIAQLEFETLFVQNEELMKNDPKLPHFCRAIFHLKLRISSGSHAFSPAKSNGCASDFPTEVLRFQVWIWDTDEVDFRNDEDVIRIQSTSTMEEFLRSGLIGTLSNIYVELIYQFAYLFIYRFLSTYIKFIFLTTTFTSIKRIDFAFFSFIEIFLR